MARKDRRKASVDSESPRRKASIDSESPRRKHSVDSSSQSPRKNRKKLSVDSSAQSPRKKRSDACKLSTSEVRRFAKEMLHEKAHLKKRMIIRTKDACYEVLREIKEGMFNYLYEVKEEGGGNFLLRTEPRTNSNTLHLYRTVQHEVVILMEASKSPSTDLKHLPRFKDAGSTEDFRFMVMQLLGENLYDITRKRLNSAFTMSTALRTAIQTLEAIRQLHSTGYLHRGLGPMVFSVGAGTKMRTVYLSEFGMPFFFRNKKARMIRKPRPYVPLMGILRLMSISTHKQKEHCRRDDLESWAFMAMEFFDLKILPWCNDMDSSEVLRKKQKTINGDYPSVFETVTLRFKHILRYISSLEYFSRPNYDHIQEVLGGIRKLKKIDFSLPYDWEVFSEVSDKLECDPVTNRKPGSSQAKSPAANSGVYVEPPKEVSKEESAYSPNPVSVGSEVSNEQDTPPKPKATVIESKKTRTQEIEDKPTERDKSEYFILMAGEKKMLPATLIASQPTEEKRKKPNANQVDDSPRFDLFD